MSKSKKTKSRKIDPRVMARPRLDALFERQARGEIDLDGLEASVRALMTGVVQSTMLDALVKRMEETPEGERETLMSLLTRLKNREVIDYLWQQVKKRGGFSVGAKMTMLVILKEMGEEVDIKDPGLYFSPREIKPRDMHTAQDLFRIGMRGLARELRESQDPAEVEAIMHRVNQMPENAIEGVGVLLEFIKSGEEAATELEADFIYALAHTTPFPDVMQKAERALERMAARDVKPVTRSILALSQDRFFGAYMTDPNHPWQQSVTVAWERAGRVIQALVFLLDFGVPWRGAIKDMFATHGMTPNEFKHELVDKPGRKMGERLYHVSLARAQAAIAAAVAANRKNHVSLPKEFNEVRHLVERWVLHPPAEAFASDSTRDELGNLPMTPDRSDKPVMLDLRDLERNETTRQWLVNYAAESDEEEPELSEEVDFLSFEDVLADVQFVHEEQSPVWWEYDWVRDYLSSLSYEPDNLERLDEELGTIEDEWWTLRDWFEYLDQGAEVHSVVDLRSFHLSEYLQKAADQDDDQGRSRAETVRDFLTYLVQYGLIPSDLPFLSGLSQILAQPDQLTFMDRPAPQGGEIAFWFRAFGEDEHSEPFTYNEWWMALVLESKFKGNRAKCRRAACGKPDEAAKLALLDQLERRLSQDSDYLDDIDNERMPYPEDYSRAEHWFAHEPVIDARAW